MIPLTTHLCLLYTCIMQKVSSQVIVKHWTFVIQKSRRDAFFKSLIGVGTKKGYIIYRGWPPSSQYTKTLKIVQFDKKSVQLIWSTWNSFLSRLFFKNFLVAHCAPPPLLGNYASVKWKFFFLRSKLTLHSAQLFRRGWCWLRWWWRNPCQKQIGCLLGLKISGVSAHRYL